MFVVELRAVPNPDFPRRRDLPVEKQIVPVATLAEASETCLRFILDHNLGGGNWAGGKIREAATGRLVATVSYNGRVWTVESE
jgi:hypothetical protein